MSVTESSSTSPYMDHARLATLDLASPTTFSGCQCMSARRPRNLIVCIDGTSNEFGQNITNVVKLFDKIDLESPYMEQHAYYSSGIGTRPKSSFILGRVVEAVSDKLDMAVAWNISKNIREAYNWLAGKYREGDKIFLFGFSRGAYQVRVLAGMINEVGLIRTPTEKQVRTAYYYYDAIRPGMPETRQVARRFKKTFSWKDSRVHFIGVWDTVSSVGLTRGDVSLPMSSSASHIRHALALDERRVKFMPEYFRETNYSTQDGKSNFVVDTLDVEHFTMSANNRHKSDSSESSSSIFGAKRSRAIDVKEVWFPGSHSDVGGKDRPGKIHQAGNISLLWMRREAVAHGLVLHPTDAVWGPDDLDYGTSDSMSPVWRVFEYLAIKHQVSFSGDGGDARRPHRLEPRHIVPTQKVHASILYANAYRPQATWGGGYDIPTIYARPEDTELDSEIWETDLFGDTEARELVNSLGDQGVTPMHLDKLLFVLRFKEGKERIRNVHHWQAKFKSLIRDRSRAPLLRLVTIVVYYEASYDPDGHQDDFAQHDTELSQDIFNDARECLNTILSAHRHRDSPRVVALLRPLTKHEILRERILTRDVLMTVMKLIDAMVKRPGLNFGQAMDGLTSLLQCNGSRRTIIEQLGAKYPRSAVSRLSRVLEVSEPQLLTAALRMTLTLARIPDATARKMCTAVKPRLRELAKAQGGMIGPLAVEILLSQYNPDDKAQLNIREEQIRENLATALIRMNFHRPDSAEGRGGCTDRGQQILRHLFGLNASVLNKKQKMLIRELKNAVAKGNARERAAATMTLLKLCETEVICTYLRDIGLLEVFVDQLQYKDMALLAAYALATCLKYRGMKDSIKQNKLLPAYIVGMLRWDYFDDSLGQVEGFQIFGEFMQDDDLRPKIMNQNLSELLGAKTGKGKLKEIRTSLICLEIFRSFNKDGPWTHDLVVQSLEHLRNHEWKIQKAGVIILSALAQTGHGVAAIGPRISEIIEMLLPEDYTPTPPVTPRPSTQVDVSVPEGHRRLAPATTESTFRLAAAQDKPTMPPSLMMGPACALRNLALNKTLRERMRESVQYSTLKYLYMSETLVDETDTSPWHIWTPTRSDVIDMLDKMIRAVDGVLSEQSLMWIGDAVPPHILHWDRLANLLRKRAVKAVMVPTAVLGVMVLAVPVVFLTPFYLSYRAYGMCKRLLLRNQGRLGSGMSAEDIFDEEEEADETDSGVHQGKPGGGPSGLRLFVRQS